MNKMSKITHKYNVILPTRGGSNMRSCTKGIFIFNLFYINLDPPQNNVSHHLLAPLISSSLFFFFFSNFTVSFWKRERGEWASRQHYSLVWKKFCRSFLPLPLGIFMAVIIALLNKYLNHSLNLESMYTLDSN